MMKHKLKSNPIQPAKKKFKKVSLPFDTLGLFTYLRTYARRHDESNPNSTIETWEECINRIISACNTQLNIGFTKSELQKLFNLLFNLKCSVAGRFLWQLGTRTVDKLGLMSLQNCAFVIVNEPVNPFTWVMNFLMLGAGCGFRILPSDINHLPIVKYVIIARKETKDADYIVPDSREGWVKLLGKVLKAHFYSGNNFTFSCILLRSRGAPIKTFGGLASGPEILCDGIFKINEILNRRTGQKLRPIDALDIMNIIGMIVVSGNVRRCIPRGSLVHTKRGLVPIEEIKLGDQVLSYDNTYNIVKNIFYQGKQSLLKITTEHSTFRCTPTHRMAVFKNNKTIWKEAQKLTQEDHLILSIKETDGKMNNIKEFAHFFGYINKKYDLTDETISLCNKYNVNRNQIPKIILESEPVTRLNYIQGLFGNNKTIFRCKNKKFLRDVQTLLFSCGIISTLSKSQIKLMSNNQPLTKVRFIEKDINEDYTYDIEVEKVNSFFCDGFLTHNSALLALGDCKDKDYLLAKRWDLEPLPPNYRCNSNNSVICNDITDILDNELFWEGYHGNGEPYGLVNLKLMQKCGRIGDYRYPDHDTQGVNPCSEQQLNNHETCCLSEIFLPNIISKQELLTCTKYLYRICKHSLRLSCMSKETERIVHKNMRMGIGITGYLQATEEQKGWLPDVYEKLRKFDVEYSLENGFPPSIKLTTCKPSGCVSKDMLVLTNKGLLNMYEIGDISADSQVWQEIENIYVLDDGVSDNNIYYIPKYHRITKFFKNGEAPTKKITTQDGLTIECTLNHQFRVIECSKYIWKHAKDLKPLDQLVVRLGGHPEYLEYRLNKTNLISKEPLFMTKEIAYLLGMIFRYSTITVDRVKFMGIQRNKLNEIIYSNFNLTTTLKNKDTYLYSKEFIEWLKINGCLKGEVPRCVRSCSKEKLRVFFDVFKSDSAGQIRDWFWCRVSERFAQQLLILFRGIGECVKLSTINKDKHIFSLIYTDEGKFWKDPIKNITDGQTSTYDIEVKDVHHYRLGGLISHNTLSILGGVTPGVHPGYAQYYIRRVRISSESSLIKLAKDHGYHVEYVKNLDNTPDRTTMVISFPYALPKGTVLAKDCDAIQQLEWVKRLQRDWSDNSVSVTVYYKKEELQKIKEWLRLNYNENIKSVSFLLHSGHGFAQAPYEEISEEEYNRLIQRCRKIENVEGICYVYSTSDQELISQQECVNGICPVR